MLEFVTTYYLNIYVYLAMAAGVICCELRHKIYKMTVRQTLFLCFLHAIFGNVGDRVTARIALGYWGGGCWYGVPLMITVSIFLLTVILKKDYETIGDMSAAGICCIHIVSKIACIFQGCCTGKVVFFYRRMPVHFPCREFEIAAYLVILFVLLHFEKNQIAKGMLWELYIIWYSVIRYISAWLRETAMDWRPFFLWIPAARVWTIAIFITGFVILFFHFKKRYGRKPSAKELLFAAIGKLPKKVEESA